MNDDSGANYEHPTAPLLRRLRVIAILALGIVLTLLTMIGWRDYDARFEHLELRNLSHARTLAGHAARSLDAVDIGMERLADRLDRIMRAGDPPPAVLHEMMVHSAGSQSLIQYVTLADPNGRLLADSRQRTPEDPHWGAIGTINSRNASPARNRVSLLRIPDGQEAGLLALRQVQAGYSGMDLFLGAGLSTSFFRGFYEEANAASRLEVALLSARGTVLAATDGFLGNETGGEGRELGSDLPLNYLESDRGHTFHAPDWNRTVGLAWVDGWPLAVMVATDTRPLLWGWFFVAGTLGLAAILVVGGTAVALRLGARYLNRLADTENELRLHVVDLEISRLQLQEQGEQATRLAEALYVARDEAEAARVEAEGARRAADKANQAKSEFLARMSHELRTPLNAILGFAEIMKEGIGAVSRNDTYTHYAQDIYESGSHLLSVINDILDLSKVEAGRFELSEEEVDLDYAARSVAKLVRETAANRGLKVAVDVAPGTPRIRSDQRVVRQMLLNLLSNALKFTPRGGRVAILVKPANGMIAVAVRDTGIGIDRKHFAKVLEPFGQVRDQSTEDVQGTGLGLPLVKSFIEAQGGRFELDSEVGQGTTVTLWFPADRIIEPPPAARAVRDDALLPEAC